LISYSAALSVPTGEYARNPALVPVARQPIVNVQPGANMAEKRRIWRGPLIFRQIRASRRNFFVTAALHIPALSNQATGIMELR